MANIYSSLLISQEGITEKGCCSASYFGNTLCIANWIDRKLIVIKDNMQTEVHYPQSGLRNVPYAITHDGNGRLFMLRDCPTFPDGTVARFSSPTGEEETLEVETVFQQCGPNASIVVNGDYAYFTSTDWNDKGSSTKNNQCGTSVWRLPLEFTDKDEPEEVFNLVENYPELKDCRGIAFDSEGALFLTCTPRETERDENDEEIGRLVKVVDSTPEILASLSDPKEVIVDKSIVSVDSIVGGEKGIVSLSATKKVDPELTFTKDGSVKELEQTIAAEQAIEKPVDLGAGKIGR